jgi:hypothetical protein
MAWMRPRVHMRHRDSETLAEISQHPAGHNIESRSVIALLEALASVDEAHHSRLLVTLGDATETLEPPRQIKCRSVIALLEALASVDETRHGRFPRDIGRRDGDVRAPKSRGY